jgi:exopolyphosphatase / guanosine-5'-triphosphate,3'-diphosphate pyrophosphatase
VRLAAIDIGSNSVHMIVADTYGPHSFRVIERERERVKLGAGAFRTGKLMPENSEAALSALERFAALCKRLKVQRVIANATSAVREAANGREFIKLVEKRAGIKVRVIDGRQEADLIYRGIRHSSDLVGKHALMMDLGGGSLEVMYGDARRLKDATSLPLGVQRLGDMFGTQEALSRRARAELHKLIEKHSGPFLRRVKRAGIDVVICTSGTQLTLGLACLRLRGRDPWGSLNGCVIQLSELRDLSAQLSNVSANDRTRLPGIDERRADVVHLGAIVLVTALEAVGAEEMQLCGASLREGLLLEEMARIHKSRAPMPDVRLASADELIEVLGADPQRAARLARLSCRLFDDMRRVHGLGKRERDLLETAALLAEIGARINFFDREHNSYQLIRGGGLRGVTDREIEIIGLTTRYGRRGSPKERHAHFAALDTEAQHLVRVLAGILRIAAGLDRGHDGRVVDVKCRERAGVVRIYVTSTKNADLEIEAAQNAARLLVKTVDRDIEIKLAN